MPQQIQREAHVFPEEEALYLHSWMPMAHHLQQSAMLLLCCFSHALQG